MTLLEGVDDAVSLLVMPCALFMWVFQPDALVDLEYHLRHIVHWRFSQCLAELLSCQSLTYSHGNWCFWRFRFDLATECTAACMLPSLSSDTMTTATSSGTTMLTTRSPLLDIVICSSLSAVAKDRGGVDFVMDSSLTVDSVRTNFEARRHTRMLRLGRQDSLRRKRLTPNNWFNEQFARCSTKIDKSLEVGVLQ